MKLRLNNSLRAALLAGMAALDVCTTSAQADIWLIADGVDINTPTASTRLYDTGKGYYFERIENNSNFSKLRDLYYSNGNSFKFLGEVYDRMPSYASGMSEYFTTDLTDDSETCWAQASMNITEYWLSYYGVFCKDSRELPFGYTYDKQYLQATGGTLSLKQNLLFLDVFNNEGDIARSYIRWFMCGSESPEFSIVEQSGKGGYWKDYYPEKGDVCLTADVGDIHELTEKLLTHMGYTNGLDGSPITRHTKGQIAYLGLFGSQGNGHAITCHGVVVGSDGLIKTLYVSNSDDIEYSVFPLYVKMHAGCPYLYTDSACTQLWEYADEYWYVSDTAAIQTSRVLRDMLAQYEDRSNSLHWTGTATDGKWDLTKPEDYSRIPDSTSGWKVLVNNEYYPIKETTDRCVVFGNISNNNEWEMVYPEGDGHVQKLTLANTSHYYNLVGNNNTLSADDLVINTGSHSQFNDITLYTTKSSIYGSTILAKGASWTGNTTVHNGGSLVLYENGEAKQTSLTMEGGSNLLLIGDGTLAAQDTTLTGIANLEMNSRYTLPHLTITGNVAWHNNCYFKVLATGDKYELDQTYAIITFSYEPTGWSTVFKTDAGTLSYSDHTIYLTYNPYPVKFWTGNGNVWTPTKLGNSNVVAKNNRITFSQSGNHQITLSGLLITPALTVSGPGNYTFVAAGSNSRITDKTSLTKRGSGTLTINCPNKYFGGTTLEVGTIVTKHAQALGTGDIVLKGGTLNMYGYKLANPLIVRGKASLKSCYNFNGTLTMESGSLSGTPLKLNEASTLYSGTIGNNLTGTGRVWKKGEGTVTLNGTNSYTGGTTIYTGTLKTGSATALGTGSLAMSWGTLDMNYMALSNNLTVKSGKPTLMHATNYKGSITLSGGTLSFASQAFGVKNLTLSGGTLNVKTPATINKMSPLAISGTLTINGATALAINGNFGVGTYTLATFTSFSGSAAHLTLSAPQASSADYTITRSGNKLVLNVTRLGDDLYWKGTTGTWAVNNSSNWYKDNGSSKTAFTQGDHTTFNNGGTITIAGEVSPGIITVNGASKLTFNSSSATPGSLTGAANLYKNGTGTLTINTSNPNWSGTIFHTGGRLVAGADKALGSGTIFISAGTLDAASHITANAVNLSGNVAILNGQNMKGTFTLNGTLAAGSYVGVIAAKNANLKKGTINGTIAAKGQAIVTGAVTIGSGSLTTPTLSIKGNSAVLTAGANGLLPGTDSTITMSNGATLNSAGNVTARSLSASGGSFINMDGSTSSTLYIADSTTLSSSGMNLNGYLKGKNLTLQNSELYQYNHGYGLQLSGVLKAADGSYLHQTGNLTASSLQLSGNSNLNLNGVAAKTANITYTASIASSAMKLYGQLKAMNLTLNKGKLYQYKHSGGVQLTGTLTMNSGSSLTVSGALKAATMNLSGGTLNMTSATLTPITVSGKLSLTGAIDFNLGCALTHGKGYKLITFGSSNLSSSSNLTKLFGLTGAGCTLRFYTNYISLVVTDSTAWNAYLTANEKVFQTAAGAVTGSTAPITTPGKAEESAPSEIGSLADLTGSSDSEKQAMADEAAAIAAAARSTMDALVQSTWGSAHAARTFTSTLENRLQHSTDLTADGSTAAWLSVIGATGRLSSNGKFAGSQFDLSGAAFGMEQRLSSGATLGLAIGNSWGKVNSFTASATDQDTQHIALYGENTLRRTATSALTLDWSVAYGRTESEAHLRGMRDEWEQKSLLLNARLSYTHALNERTSVSTFAGLEYLATDGGDLVGGASTGSVQNLRAEIGAGIAHRLTDRSSIFAELSFIGDAVRHNPTAAIGTYRSKGANPGRAGMEFSLGGRYEISDNWSVNASYNLELLRRANNHSANVGLSREF